MYCLRMKVFAQISVIRTEFKISQLGFSTITKDLLISKLSTNLVPFLFSVYHSDQLFLKPPPALHTHCLLIPTSSWLKCRCTAGTRRFPNRVQLVVDMVRVLFDDWINTITWISIGLAKNFAQVFLHHLMEKPGQTFLPTQYY